MLAPSVQHGRGGAVGYLAGDGSDGFVTFPKRRGRDGVQLPWSNIALNMGGASVGQRLPSGRVAILSYLMYYCVNYMHFTTSSTHFIHSPMYLNEFWRCEDTLFQMVWDTTMLLCMKSNIALCHNS